MRTEPPPSLPTASGPHARRHRSTRARAGAAGRALQVPRVAGRLEHGVVACPAVAELRHVGLAQDDRARIPQTLDHHVVLLGHEILVGDRAGDGGEVLGADEVLDPDRDARERAWVLARRDPGIHFAGGGAGVVGRRRAEGVEMGFHLLHVGDDRVRDFDCRKLPGTHPRSQRHGVHPADFVGLRHEPLPFSGCRLGGPAWQAVWRGAVRKATLHRPVPPRPSPFEPDMI